MLTQKNIFILFLIIFNISFQTSCKLFKDQDQFNNANKIIYKLYENFNNNKSLDSVALDIKDYGKYAKVVTIEKNYLQNRFMQNEIITNKSKEIEQLTIGPNESVDKYVSLINELIKLLDDRIKNEKQTNKSLLTDLENLHFENNYFKNYILNSRKRIKFEESYSNKLTAKNIIILKKSQELITLYKNPTPDLNKESTLKNEIAILNSNYNGLLNDFNSKIQEKMNAHLRSTPK